MLRFERDIELYEMAKDISYRTIDRNVQLSVASICSKNKETQAEFVKPQNKLTADDLVQRYVMALIIMKKPCPKSKREIEEIKTFKNYAYKALELGSTINDIKRIYKVNNGEASARMQTAVRQRQLAIQNGNINNDYPVIEQIVKDVKPTQYMLFSSKVVSDEKYKIVEHAINDYIMGTAIACNYDLDEFADDLQDAFGQYVIEHNKNKNIINVQIELDDDVYFKFIVKPDDYTLESPDDFDLKENLTFYRYNNQYVKLMDYMAYAIYENIIQPYMADKFENMQNTNKTNASQVIKNYDMNGVVNYYNWFNSNICEILRNNANYKIDVNYGDYLGKVKSLYYWAEKGKYMMSIGLENESSEINKDVEMKDILAQDPNIDDYYYRFRDPDLEKWSEEGMNNAVYVCQVRDLNRFGRYAYNAVKSEIESGHIK